MKIIAILSVLILITSCSQRITDFTLISTKNNNLARNSYNRVRSEDCAHLLLNIIPVNGNMIPDLKEAIDRGIERGGGVALSDGVVYHKFFFIPLLWISSCYVVEGSVVKN